MHDGIGHIVSPPWQGDPPRGRTPPPMVNVLAVRILLECILVITMHFKWVLLRRDRDRDILTRLRLGHQRPLNRRCPDEKYQDVNNNRLTEYPGTPAWTPATSKLRVSNCRWTPAIYWSLVSESQSRQNISISISSSQDPRILNGVKGYNFKIYI